MRKYVIILLAALMLLSGCTGTQNGIDSPAEVTEEVTAVENTTPNKQEPSQSPSPTAEPTPEIQVYDFDSVSSRSLNGLLLEQDIPEETTQLILVAVGINYDKMYLMEKNSVGMWQVVHGPFDVQLGKNGLGKEEEGDGKSPIGIYELGYAFGRDGAPEGTIWPWRDTEGGDMWIEDPDSEYYNMFLQEDSVEEPDWKNYSNLDIAVFSRAVEIRYNSEREPGLGSAIFLHIWISSTRDTNSCTAISRENIETVIKWMNPEANTMIAQLPHELIGYGDLVYLTDFSTDIIADIKFAEDDNIFGKALAGYEDNQVLTKADIAKALVDANDMLKNYGAKLIVYDAYRPLEAFDEIEDWLNELEDTNTKETYYKDLTKEELRAEYFDYDANRLYTRAQIVHVGLADLEGNPLDMGGEYMVFDEYASYFCEGLSQEAIYNREILHDFMLQAGFLSVDNQWWKFEYNPYLYVIKYDEIIK